MFTEVVILSLSLMDTHAPSTKDHEHSRRGKGRAAAYTKIAGHLIAQNDQQAFLRNDLNKSQSIAM